MLVNWDCPDCGNGNSDSTNHAEINTCICEECKAECEVYFEIEVTEDQLPTTQPNSLKWGFVKTLVDQPKRKATLDNCIPQNDTLVLGSMVAL